MVFCWWRRGNRVWRVRGLLYKLALAELLVPEATYPEHWLDDISAAAALLREAGVVVTEVSDTLGGTEPIRRMGEIYFP